jgi:hypothetical protein
VFDDRLVATGSDDHVDLQSWSAGIMVGHEF